MGWWWEGMGIGAPISACCASEFTCFFFLFTLQLRSFFHSYLFTFYQSSCKGCSRRPVCVLLGTNTARTHILLLAFELIYIRYTKDMTQVWTITMKHWQKIYIYLTWWFSCFFPPLSLSHLRTIPRLFPRAFLGSTVTPCQILKWTLALKSTCESQLRRYERNFFLPSIYNLPMSDNLYFVSRFWI